MNSDLIQRIRDHALIHYSEDGWDILFECWTDSDIIDCVGDARTFEAAIIALSDTLSLLDEYRQEIQSA